MKSFNSEAFSMAVNLRREMERLTLRELGDSLGGISASTLSRIENGDKPDIESFISLFAWLQLPIERFIKESADA